MGPTSVAVTGAAPAPPRAVGRGQRSAPEGPDKVAAVVAGGMLQMPTADLCERARAVRRRTHGHRVTFSPKVFIPLTQLCRDRCGYCTFAKPPARLQSA